MSALLPRQSADSVCLFCRQGLLRPWRQQQQQLRPRFLEGARIPNRAGLFAHPQQRRRFLSGTATAQMPPPPPPPLAQAAEPTPAEQPSSAAATASPTTPYRRYALYSDSTAPMTIRPPPPPPAAEQAAAIPDLAAAATAAAAAAAEQAAPEPAAQAEMDEAKPAAAAAATAAAVTAAPAAAPAAGAKKRPSKLRAPRKAAMRLTPSAVEQVRELLEGPEPKLIKVGVRNRGCSGLAYNLEYVDKPGAFDELVEQDGVRVLVDSKALFSIIGSEMDWVEDKLNQRFVFRNPNIKEECGCGESFMV